MRNKKTLTFVGDTGGSVVTDDYANRLEINFYMGVGTNYSSGTLETTWTAGTTADRAVGQVNAFDNTSNNILFTIGEGLSIVMAKNLYFLNGNFFITSVSAPSTSKLKYSMVLGDFCFLSIEDNDVDFKNLILHLLEFFFNIFDLF